MTLGVPDMRLTFCVTSPSVTNLSKKRAVKSKVNFQIKSFLIIELRADTSAKIVTICLDIEKTHFMQFALY